MIMNNGMILQSQLRQLDISAKYIRENVGTQVATYYFDLINSLDINKVKDKVIKVLSAYNHKRLKAKVEHGKDYCFMVDMELDNKQLLTYNCMNKKISTKARSINNIVSYIGYDNTGDLIELDFGKIPHILVSGTTGSGKSVLLNTLIASFFHTTMSKYFQLYIIDTKRISFEQYRNCSNVEIIDEIPQAITTLEYVILLMENRYKELQKDNTITFKQVFVIVDELADLVLSSDSDLIMNYLIRLSQKARACNIHLILATQRPTVNVVNGLLKANLDCRLCLKVASVRDSVVALDHKGAEKLLGKGDLIIKMPYESFERRGQVALTTEQELKDILVINKKYDTIYKE